MSAQAEILPLPVAEPTAAADPACDLEQSDMAGPLPPADASQPRRNGKLAHLPKAQRDLINHLLDEGDTYETIVRKLAEQGVILNLRSLSDWFHGGYQDELQARERRAMLVNSQDRLLALARKEDAPDLSYVGLQLAVTQLTQQLYEIAPGAHKESFQTDTQQYLRMLNTLARMSKAMLALQQHRDQAAKGQALQLAAKDPDRDLNDNEYGGIVNKMDQVFKVRRRRTPATLPAAPKSDVGGSPSSSQPLSQPLSQPSSSPHASRITHHASPCNDATMQRCNGPSSPTPLTGSPTHPLTAPATPPPPAPASPTPATAASVPVGPLPPAGVPATSPAPIHQSNNPIIHNGPSSIPSFHHSITPVPAERCHECNSLLPPLLSSGDRPSPYCNKCGTALRPPGALIEYCPKCRHVLQELNANGTRPTPECPHCNKPLPPPPPKIDH